MSRRRWLQAALPAAALALPAATARPLRFLAFDQDGAPCDARFLARLLLTDRAGRPWPVVPTVSQNGAATIDLPPGSFEISMVLPVRDFGTVYLYADNAGGLYPPREGEYLLNYEFARSRAAFVRRYVKAAEAAGVSFSAAVLGRLERGENAVKRAAEAKETAARVGYSNESLSESMWAGEIAALERARHRIARQGPRPGFLIGAYGYPFAKTPDHLRLFTDLCNNATLALYRRGTDAPYFRPGLEPEEGQPNYSLADATLDQMAAAKLTVKGHPLMWFGRPGLPEFLRTKSWDALKQSCRDHIFRTVARYKSRIHMWDVINEAHDQANELNFNHAQLLELTRSASEWTRQADPTAFRVVNACCTWAEALPTRRTPDGPDKTWNALNYYAAVQEARIPYEAIGLQFYNPLRDLLEVERQMERFFVFGKPIHITELGISSSSEPDKRSQFVPSPEVWHGARWTEQIQADWTEQYYTICYSKPEIEVVSWWNFTDPGLHSFGGLLYDDLRPKEAYHRLLKLVRSWRAV
jgi:endo-1,4-beta-xylanase